MKITYISASIIPSTKANSVHVMKMCNGLAKNGHEVTLVGTEGGDTLDNIYDYYNVDKSFQLKLSKNNKLSPVFRLITGLKHTIGADLIYTRWIVAAIVLILFTTKKVIYEHHSPFKHGLYRYFEFRIIKSKKIVRHVFITNSLKKYYQKSYPLIDNEKLIVLPDAADVVGYDEEHQQQFDCVYVGSFQKGKGVDLTIKLANNLPHIKFAIVGGSKEEVEKKKSLSINENIKWFGFLPHQETHLIIQKAKIALLPNQPKVLVGDSNQDIGEWTSPMKLFEYMANRMPIIASDLPVLREVLIDEQNCLLVDYNDVTEWMNAVNQLLNNKKLMRRISFNAYKDFKEKYTWKGRAAKAIQNVI